ncbi:brevican core protein [Spea bombifrons]|uniref:brevican core protein n=1 Tax=Spea bombifrons TaxID=233779 RepID=UPI00234A581B|nr:brevican core protein [Spea bombifrons]
MKLDLWLLLLTRVAFSFASEDNDNSEDHKVLKVKIGNSTTPAALAGTLTLPCHITHQSWIEGASVGRRAVLGTHRVKWSFISNGKEEEILVARGHKVKITEGYRSRASLPHYSTSASDATLILNDLRTNDSGIYRCHVQHGIEDDHDMVEVKVKGVVFLYREGTSRYTYSFFKAQEACSRIRAHIATADQLLAAYHSGYEQCDAGWIADQTVRYPIQRPREGCYGDMDGYPGVRNYGVLDPEDMYDVYCYIEELNGEVFLGSTLEKFTLEEAKDYCRKLGTRVATTGQLYAAWSEGLDHCNPGWLSDGSVRYPIVTPTERCGGNSPGVKTIFQFRNQTGFPDSQTKYDVYCFRDNGHHGAVMGIRDVITLNENFEELKTSEVNSENEAQGVVDTIPLNTAEAIQKILPEVANTSTSVDHELSRPTKANLFSTSKSTQMYEESSISHQHSIESLTVKPTTGMILQSSTAYDHGLITASMDRPDSSSNEDTLSTSGVRADFPTESTAGESTSVVIHTNSESENDYPDDNITALIEEMGFAPSELSSPSPNVPIPQELDPTQVHSEDKEIISRESDEGPFPSDPTKIYVDPTTVNAILKSQADNREEDKTINPTRWISISNHTAEPNDFEASGRGQPSSMNDMVHGDIARLTSTHSQPEAVTSHQAQVLEADVASSTTPIYQSLPSNYNSKGSDLEEGSGDISGPMWFKLAKETSINHQTTTNQHAVNTTANSPSSFTDTTIFQNVNWQINEETSTAHIPNLMSSSVSPVASTPKDAQVEESYGNMEVSPTSESHVDPNSSEDISASRMYNPPYTYNPLPADNPDASINHPLQKPSQSNKSTTTTNPLPIVPTERAIRGTSANFSDDCFPNPCENGGTCIEEEDGDFHCLCLPGYMGKACDINMEKCLDGWDAFQGFCYKHFHTRRSWEEAETHCRESGGHLVSIMTPEEQDFVNDKYREYQWTGLNDRTIEGDFQWSDGNPLLYENWNHQQPDSYFLSGENCVVMVWHDRGLWSDVPCNYHLTYTCKIGLVSCGPPPEVVNASTYGRPKALYQIGSVVGYRCNDGFHQRNSPVIKCLADGLWEEPQVDCVPALQ